MSLKKIFFAVVCVLSVVACKTGGWGGVSEELAPSVPNYVLFEVDSARLDQAALDSINKQIDWLKSNQDINVVIEGHCDERGTREYNLALGAKRANSVKSYLRSSGIKQSRIATISYGKERPPIPGTGEEVWAKNRRAITVVN